MNQSAPAEYIAAADNPLASSENFTELFQAEQLEEYKRIRNISRLMRLKEDLDVALKEIMEKMRESQLSTRPISSSATLLT